MLAVLSPSKTLDFGSKAVTRKCSEPEFLSDSRELVDKLRSLSERQLRNLMDISPKLAALNHERYQTWSPPFTPKNARQSLLAFKGDVYNGFNLEEYSPKDFEFAQKHLRILSGLYGVLKPLDLIQPYRLEMGTSLKTGRGKDLYAFWGTAITDALNRELDNRAQPVLVNLASNEYFSSVDEGRLQARVISPAFKDLNKGKYKILSFFAKRARGEMANFIIRNRITNPSGLTDFNAVGYRYDAESSTEDKPVFLRDQPE